MRRIRLGALFGCALFASAFIVERAQAQMPITFVAGPTFQTISSDEFDDASSTTGFFAAIGTSFQLNERFALSPFLGYMQKGADFDGETASYDYIEIPVLLGTGFPVGENGSFSVFAGPQFGFQINCDEDGFDCTEFEDQKGTEFGVMGGAGFGFPAGGGMIGVGGGLDFGLTDIYEDLDYKTRTYFLFVEYQKTMGGM